jgi:hypothetical protein
MALAPGTRLGPYEILAPLGAGGMGEVYRARDTRLERTVAIKILPAQFSCDPVRKQRFEREAKTISSLNHPNICVLYDVGNQDGVEYLVMECIEGETLAKRLERGPVTLDQVLKYGEQRIRNVDRSYSAPAVALSQLRWVDGRRRTTHRGTTPTPISSAPGHGCMKSLAHTPHCRRATERLAQVCLHYSLTSSSRSYLASPTAIDSCLYRRIGCYSTCRDDSGELLQSPSLHSICISPASAAPAASF